MPDTAAPYITSNNQPVFDTDSGKIELYSSELKNKGFDPVAKIYSGRPAEGRLFQAALRKKPCTHLQQNDKQ